MSSTSVPVVDQQQQAPPMTTEVVGQAYPRAHHQGSVGPVIGVLAVIAVLGVIAGMIGRLCSGRRGHYSYDLEGWVERKCSSCIDGNLGPPPPPPEIPVAAPVVPPPEEPKEGELSEEQTHQPQQQQQQRQKQKEKQKLKLNSHASTSQS